MNLVDSCGWIEYLTDGKNADFFAFPLQDIENLIVPSVCIYEVFRKVLRERGKESALQVLALMQQGSIIELDFDLAIQSAELGLEFGLPFADSVIFASARAYNAVIWTQDKHFENIANVRYIEASK
jgi:predicted nucleic acid-binding protein